MSRDVQNFDLIIVGAGSGNMIPLPEMETWHLAIVEPDKFGGTCLNRGCIPSKMLLYPAEVAETAEQVANRLTEVVQTVGFPWLSVTIEGEVARLMGEAPDAENKAAAYLAAKAIINADGSANDIISLVRDETRIASEE